MTNAIRRLIKDCRNGQAIKYCPVYMANRIRNLSNYPYDNWRWQRLNEVKDIIMKTAEVQNEL